MTLSTITLGHILQGTNPPPAVITPADNTRQIDQILADADNQMSTNPEFQHETNQHVAKQLFIKQQTDNYLHDKVNLQDVVNNFMSRQHSPNTKRNYRNAIDKLTKYATDNQLSVLRFTPANASDFINTLYQKLSTRTIRLTITSCAQFYRYLIYTHPELQAINPFLMTKLPRIIDRYQKDWVTKHDVATLKRHFKAINRLDLYAVTHLIDKYGWRAGILTSMKITPTTLKYTSTSKGSQKEGKLTKADYQLILDSNILNINLNTLQVMFCRHAKKLFKADKLSCSPSLHDIRRHHIDSEFDSVNGREVVDLCYKFHDSPMTTLSHYVNKQARRSA